jgi:hypothetical protein
MSINLTTAQRKWLMTHTTGVSAQTPLGDILRKYYVSQIGGLSANVHALGDLEKQWLRKAIVDAGATPVNTKWVSELWKQIVGALGLRVSKYEKENKLTFYLNAA